jgi:hypothetical protein
LLYVERASETFRREDFSQRNELKVAASCHVDHHLLVDSRGGITLLGLHFKGIVHIFIV